MKTEIKCVPKGERLVCSGRECSSYQRVEGHQIWKCIANHGMTSTSRHPGSICHPGERQRVAQLVAENASLRKANAQLRRVETRTKVLRERVTDLTDEIKWAKEAAFNAVPGRPESGSMMQDTLLAQIAVLVRAFEARVDRWSVRAGAAELERDRLLAHMRVPSDENYEDAICMTEGHKHVNREAEAICSLRWQLEEAREIVAKLKAEEEKAQATFRALSGPILPELLVGIAEGRVHLALQAQITMEPLQGGSPEWYERLDRVSRALTDAFFRMKDVYANGAGDMDAFYTARNAAARMIVAALDAAPKANTCAPSTEGLLDKEIEDHG